MGGIVQQKTGVPFLLVVAVRCAFVDEAWIQCERLGKVLQAVSDVSCDSPGQWLVLRRLGGKRRSPESLLRNVCTLLRQGQGAEKEMFF